MNVFKIGKVVHFFDKTGMAMIELSGNLGTGEKIRFEWDGEKLFDQTVDVLKMDYKNVDNAKAGQMVGFKTSQKVEVDTVVYKLN